MLIWLIEHEGKSAPLSAATATAIREPIEPFRRHLAEKLSALTDDDGDLRVVFVVDSDGTVRIDLRGDIHAVNRARDLLGPEDVVGPRLS